MKPLDYSVNRPDPIIIGLADGNRERTNAGNRFVYTAGAEHGWDVSYLSTYKLAYDPIGKSYDIVPIQDAMITPELVTSSSVGGYKSSFFDISNETGDGMVIGCRQYLQHQLHSRTWDMYGCTIDDSVIDDNYYSGSTAYILRSLGLCSFDFVPADNQYQGVGYPDEQNNQCRRGNTAGALIQNETTTLAFVLGGTCYNAPGSVGQIPDNTPGGIFIASRSYPDSQDNAPGFLEQSEGDNRDNPLRATADPAGEAVTVSYISDENMDARISLIDMSGRVLTTNSFSISQGNNMISLPSRVADGIYFVLLKNGVSSRSAKVLIIR